FALKVKVKVGTPKAGDILFSLGTKAAGSDNPEAYNIEIGKQITITANTPIGALWATRSLLQMAEHSLSLPCGVIGDYPAYDKRGFMLDVARKYFSMEYLHAVVKVMSYYKMNTFQVHLNDNGFKEFAGNDWDKTYSAFRLESETFPGLAASDGHYTKKEFRQFQIDALALGVTIIPEIDAPAHTLSFGKYMPEVASKKYGKDHFDLFNPKTYEFMDRLWAEYLSGDEPVFVNEYVHIGTDEYSNKDTVVVEKFRYFTDHYIKYVESFGKKAALWGALTHANGSTPVKVKDVLMSCWYNGYAEPQDMIKAGYEVLSVPDGYLYIVPAAGYYYDYLNTKYLYESWTPNMIGKEVFEPAHPQIKGGMFAVWNDHCGNGISFQDVHHRLMPAMQTLAVKMWDGANTTMPYNEFETSRQLLSEAPGVNILARPKGGKKGEILNIAKPQQGQENQISDIGYNYRVEFELTALAADKGAVLFESPSSKFYLAEPAEGKVGYSRDGYDYRFNYTVPLNHKVALAIEGTNKETKLFVDGKLLETLAIVPHTISPKMKWVQTLVFPLAKIGDFSGEMENLKVVAM
ncbi:MAG: glycoside hydrolase family 20 protein, partial [Mucinivorans sp.]